MMKQTLARANLTKQTIKTESVSKNEKSLSKKESINRSISKNAKYKIDAITKDNFENSNLKINIT
jgi:hypothetical protein